jgi:hypothetical protein
MVIKKELTKAERRLKENMLLKELLQVTPPMAPDSTSSSEPTKNFVVPDHLIAMVERMRADHPDSSDEELASILKYS